MILSQVEFGVLVLKKTSNSKKSSGSQFVSNFIMIIKYQNINDMLLLI